MALMKLSAGQQWKHRHRERSCVDSGGRRGLDKLRKWHGNIYTTMCEIHSQWEFAVRCRMFKPGTL